MNERELITLMGEKGLPRAIEAAADFLASMGFHDAAKELRGRLDDAETLLWLDNE